MYTAVAVYTAAAVYTAVACHSRNSGPWTEKQCQEIQTLIKYIQIFLIRRPPVGFEGVGWACRLQGLPGHGLGSPCTRLNLIVIWMYFILGGNNYVQGEVPRTLGGAPSPRTPLGRRCF